MNAPTRTVPRPGWRAMSTADLARVSAIADAIHPAHPEEPAVFAERCALFPEGCLVLEVDGGIGGYVVAHPWRLHAPPSLNARLGALPRDADCLYLHDIALLPSARGRGAAADAVARLVALAGTYALPALALIAISGTLPFWSRHGFAVVDAPELAGKLASYDAEARLMRRALR